MKRGFKTEAERMAVAVRQGLKTLPHGPLPGWKLAAKLDIRILEINEVAGFARALNIGKGAARSSATLLAGTDPAVVYAAAQPRTRQESRLMRGLAHVLLDHVPAGTVERCGVRFRRFDAAQEAEAAYLAGCLQIPREGLLWAGRRRMSTAEIARHFGASEQMVRYRRNVTGVDRQLARRVR